MADLRNSFDTRAFMARLHRVAVARGKTMKEVAAETGVNQTTLSRMNSGQRVCDAASLAALSAWAGINPVQFFSPHRRDSSRNSKVRNTRLGGEHG